MNSQQQLLSNYEQPSTPLMNEKLPGIDRLPKLEDDATPSPTVPVSFIENDNKQMYNAYLPPPPPSSFNPGNMLYNQHMSPPLTPAVSPSTILLDPMHFKRKFSVDIGPFGFGTAIPHHPATLQYQQDAYRRSSCSSAVNMDMMQQQVNDYGFLSSNNNDVSEAKPRRGSRAHMNGPATQHKHVCKYPYCNWSFKRYEHLKRHILVHTGKRPHICHYPGCGKSFSRSDNFHAHYRTHMKKANMMGTKKSASIKSSSSPDQTNATASSAAAATTTTTTTTTATTTTSSASQASAAAAAAAAAAVAVAAAAAVSASSVTSSISTPSPQVFDHTQPFDMSSYQEMYDRQFEGSTTSYTQHSYLQQDHSFGDSSSSPSSLLDHSRDSHCFYHTSPQHNYMTSMQGDSYGYNYTSNEPLHAAAVTTNKSGRKSSTSNSDKSHACPVLQCQRRFKRLEHLKRHMRIHTLERPFSCTFPNCHKTFSRSDNLSAHMKTHQRVQYPRRKQKQQQQQQEQQQESTNMISNMVDMSWHSAGTVGC